ncbi:MAG TPA: 2-phospho-L-lactate guanylyltransferase [Thermomicrobiales bacterium]|nr:2-phospho-L-lactate guanylyltransferase [Thermomicrobiales bacterium]
MSRTLAVIPVRGAMRTKTRLAPLFGAGARVCLVRHMLLHVLDAIEQSGVVDHTLIVTRDPDAVPDQITESPSCTVAAQPGEGLNAAIELGRDRAVAGGYDQVLILLPDLPMLVPGDVGALLAESAPVVIAADRHGTGTNALLLRLCGPGERLQFAFGPRSAARHIAEIDRLGVRWTMVDTSGLRHDLDTPDDWQVFPEAVHRRLLECIVEPTAGGTSGGVDDDEVDECYAARAVSPSCHARASNG